GARCRWCRFGWPWADDSGWPTRRRSFRLRSRGWTGGPGFLEHPLHGVLHELAAGFEIELAFDLLAVGVHGLCADVQASADVAGAQALAEEFENFELAVGE